MQKQFLLTLRYDGTAYSGWQVQDNAITIQQKFQDAIESVTGVRSDVIGCSRTDSGVHADMFCCTFFTSYDISCFSLIRALNAYLPYDISVYDCKVVDSDFHARYDAKRKVYHYNIWNSNARNPFLSKYSLHVVRKMDLNLMNRAASNIIGTHDFAAFCSADSNVKSAGKSTVRTVLDCNVTKSGELITMSISAEGFLHNMIRIIAGTLVEISTGKRDKNDITKALDSLNRLDVGVTAPACGLILKQVIY